MSAVGSLMWTLLCFFVPMVWADQKSCAIGETCGQNLLQTGSRSREYIQSASSLSVDQEEKFVADAATSATSATPAADFELLGGGYCATAEGTVPQGMGVVIVDSPEACAEDCASKEFPFACYGFTYAPGVHQRCAQFTGKPDHGDGSWGWKCYRVNRVVRLPKPFGYLPAMAGYCGQADGSETLGLGVIEKDSIQECADYCSILTALRAPQPCHGFAYAPGFHNLCHLFGKKPTQGMGNDGWYCYAREEVVEIQLQGNQHSDSDDTVGWFSPSGNMLKGFEIYKSLQRPEWSKTLRCEGAQCEACWGDTACWHMPPGQGSRHIGRNLNYDGSGPWTSFKNTIHVKCGAKQLWFVLMVFEVENGVLRFFWDGAEISKENGFSLWPINPDADDLTLSDFHYLHRSQGQSFQAVATLPVSTAGGHTFDMVFTPSGGPSKVRLASFKFLSEASYAECEDSKMCMELLAVNDVEYLELRSKNQVQYECLTEASPDIESACGQWRACLSADAQADILLLLRSAGVGATATSLSQANIRASVDGQTAENATKSDSSSTHCIDPGTEDVLSWTCDCLEPMKAECADRDGYDTLEACLTDLACERHEQFGLCAHWVEGYCSSASLLQHAHATNKRNEVLEDSAGMKSCQ